MLVEDNPGDVGLIREVLEHYAVAGELAVIADGEQAIEFVNEVDAKRWRCPDLLILDLNLPRRSGLEVLRRMRASAECGRVPVLILTSSDNEQDKAEAARLGASRYIRKPTRLEEFMALGSVFREAMAQGGKFK